MDTLFDPLHDDSVVVERADDLLAAYLVARYDDRAAGIARGRAKLAESDDARASRYIADKIKQIERSV